jgi:MFS transporter, DHA1 family, inner membrane transport protein
MNKKEYIIVSLLALLNFSVILDFMIMMPLGNLLMPEWKIDTTQFSHIVGAYPLAACLSSISAIFFADKFDRKYFLIIAFAGFLIATFFCGLATGYYSMCLARIVTGMFGGLIGAQVLSIVSDLIAYEKRGRAMGLLMAGFSLASVVGIPSSLGLANHYGWQFPFYLIAVVGLLVLVLIIKFIPNVNAHLANPLPLKERIEGVKEIFHSKKQILAVLLMSTMMFGHFLIIPLLNPFMVNNVLIPQKQTPLVYLVGGISSIIAAAIAGKMADKHGKFPVLIISLLASLPLIYMVSHLHPWSLPVVLTIFFFWFAASFARSVPAQAMLSGTASPKTRGSLMNVSSSVNQLFTGLASVISGLVAYNDNNHVIHGYGNLGLLSILFISVAGIIAWFLHKSIDNSSME